MDSFKFKYTDPESGVGFLFSVERTEGFFFYILAMLFVGNQKGKMYSAPLSL